LAYAYPYVKAEPQPDSADKVADAYVDRVLESGAEGFIHLDQGGRDSNLQPPAVTPRKRRGPKR